MIILFQYYFLSRYGRVILSNSRLFNNPKENEHTFKLINMLSIKS